MARTRGFPHQYHLQRQGMEVAVEVVDDKEGVTERQSQIRDLLCLLNSLMEGTGRRALPCTQRRA